MTQVHPDKKAKTTLMLLNTEKAQGPLPLDKAAMPPTQPPLPSAFSPVASPPVSAELAAERAAALAAGWPIPDEGPWCQRYSVEVRQRPGFYDPPDLYSSPVRAARIEREYPEIHAWADRIALAWYGKTFRKVASPARRNRIVAAMLYAAHSQGNARIAGVEPYLQLLRAHAAELAVGWAVALAHALAQAVSSLAGGTLLTGKQQTLGKGASQLLAKIAEATEAIGLLAQMVEAGTLGDVEAAGAVAAQVLDVLDDVTELTPGQLDNRILAAIGTRLQAGLDAAAAVAAAVHEG